MSTTIAGPDGKARCRWCAVGLGGGAFMFPAPIWVDLAGLAAVIPALVLLRLAPRPAESAGRT